jgi:alpha-galactosidase
MKENVVLIGAGSAMFTRGLVADLIRRRQPCELGLIDIDPQALAVAEGLTRKMIDAKQAPIRLRASTDRRAVLPGATVVICTVGVGGRRAWEQDVFIPRKYGIYQPVGDTVMPGGTSRALRMIPAMVEIAKDVLDLCPNALFFNYGNPMSPVCRGIRKATGANVTGLCHGVFHVGKWLAEQLGVAPDCLKYTAVGINHLTWFTEIRVDGQDAMPRLQAMARQKLSQAQSLGDVTDAFSWQLVELFGAFPAVLDRHVTEFFPHLFSKEKSYYGKTLGLNASSAEWGNDAFSFEYVIEMGDRIFAEMSEQALSPDPLPADYFDRMSGEHEQVLDIVDSIRRDTGDIYSANLSNQGQVPNLPADAVIEGPAIATASGLKAIAQRPLSPGLAGTLATRFQWVETVVDAALTGDRKKFAQALLIDGAVDSIDVAYQLADELLAVHAPYLPQFKPAA